VVTRCPADERRLGMQPSAEPRYEVEWTKHATEDLYAKVTSARVARDLVEVAETALDHHVPEDGGQVEWRLWRRGLTPARRVELDAAEAAGRDDDDGREQSWHYVLVYKRRGWALHLRHRYKILAILNDGDLIAALLDLHN
jgi:hypothetical protein